MPVGDGGDIAVGCDEIADPEAGNGDLRETRDVERPLRRKGGHRRRPVLNHRTENIVFNDRDVMNNTDVWVRQGAYGTEDDPSAVSTWRRQGNTLSFPRIQGTDTVGDIVGVGAGVDPARIGERVMVDFSIYNRDDDSLADIDYMGHGRDGGYAEYMVLPAENAHVVATDLTDVELATFCCAYLTGERM